MTSNIVASTLLHELSYLGGARDRACAAPQFAFELDFESTLVWPDVAFDSASPSSFYAEASRPELTAMLDGVAQMLGDRAPRVATFVNRHMKRALLRRSSAIGGASSASNRALVGLCLLTNMHLPADRTLVCAEALLHESIHQYLYTTELESGNFCDLDEARTYRSPWSGNRIPLHSLVHASFVWFGLLSLWCQLAQCPGEDASADEAALLRDRAGGIVFGFSFLGPMLRSPGFPRAAVRSDVLALIEHIARFAGSDFERGRTGRIGQSLQDAERGAWLPAFSARLTQLDRAWQ
jgi:hypothetical protein